MLGRELYPVEKRIAFQEFGVPDRFRESDRDGEDLPHEAHHRAPRPRRRDLALLHAWVTHPRSVFWGMQDATRRARCTTEYARIADDPHHDALLGRADGVPAFLVERYDPAHSELAGLPDLPPGDVGHARAGRPDRPSPSTASPRRSCAAVMEAVLRRPGRRAASSSSPTCATTRSPQLNAAVGFVVARDGRAARQDRGAQLLHPRRLRRVRPRRTDEHATCDT